MHRRAAVLLALTLVGATLSSVPASASAEQPPKLFGLATQDWEPDFNTFTADAGRSPAFQQFYATIDDSWPKPWVEGRLSVLHQSGAVGYFELTTNDKAAYLAGDFDANIDAMVDQFAGWLDQDPTHGLLLAPFPEANLTDFEWGGDPAMYKDFFLRLRAEFDERGIGRDQLRLVFAMNGLSSTGYSYSQFYPGDDEADIIGFSKLNRGGSNWRDYEETFEMHIVEMQQEISYTKPMIITRTGSVDNANGDRTEWINDMFEGLAAESQIIGAIYFSRDKSSASNQIDFRIVVDGELDPAVVDGYADWSEPTDTRWIFDGRMDTWEANRVDELVFLDALDSPFLTEILWLESSGITGGCAPAMFCPDDTVTRGQMASFLARALSLPEPTGDHFSDDDGTTHENNINRLAEAGITGGCGEDQFCPAAEITRAQMATFLARALGLPDSASDWFTDDDGDVHEDNINRLADSGITQGCEDGLFCPGDSVIRAHMAAFLFRALGP